MKKFLAILLVLGFTGCMSSMLPQKRTESVQATESIANAQNLMIEKVTTSGMGADGQPFHEELKLSHDSSSNAGAREDVSSKISIPVMVSIFIGCLGLVLLMGMWILFSKFSNLGRAADNGLATLARSIQTMAATVPDPTVKAQLLGLLSEAEKQRGKLK